MFRNIFLLLLLSIFLGCQSSAEAGSPDMPVATQKNEEAAELIRACPQKLVINQGLRALFMSSAQIWVQCHYNQEQILKVYAFTREH